MNSIRHLKSNGYSDQDILDLALMFDTQLKSLTSKINESSHNDIFEELHRLKGACELLYLKDTSKKLADLNKSETTEIDMSELLNILELLQIEVSTILDNINRT